MTLLPDKKKPTQTFGTIEEALEEFKRVEKDIVTVVIKYDITLKDGTRRQGTKTVTQMKRKDD